jgi:hypothetical protein
MCRHSVPDVPTKTFLMCRHSVPDVPKRGPIRVSGSERYENLPPGVSLGGGYRHIRNTARSARRYHEWWRA